MNNKYSIKERFNDKYFIIFSILCLIMMISPFFTVMKDGSSSLNYIYNEGHVADGVIVIPLIFLALMLNMFGLKKSSLIPLSLVLLLLVVLLINLANSNYLSYATFNFYLMYICLIGIIVTNILMIFKKR